MPSKRPQAVLVVRSIVINSDDKILIMKRAGDDRYKAGFWEFPGGKLEEGQNLEEAVSREVKEEANIKISDISRVSYVESQVIESGPYKGLPYIVIVATSTTKNHDVELTDEHSEYKWVSSDNMPDLEYKEHVKPSLEIFNKYE